LDPLALLDSKPGEAGEYGEGRERETFLKMRDHAIHVESR
jgi:hypothetical protein